METKAKHTPAPWYFEPYPESSGFTIGARGLRSIAVTTGKSLDCLKDENEANAHLIAAAPDLLEALRVISGAYERATGLPAPSQVQRAITKAEGK